MSCLFLSFPSTSTEKDEVEEWVERTVTDRHELGDGGGGGQLVAVVGEDADEVDDEERREADEKPDRDRHRHLDDVPLRRQRHFQHREPTERYRPERDLGSTVQLCRVGRCELATARSVSRRQCHSSRHADEARLRTAVVRRLLTGRAFWVGPCRRAGRGLSSARRHEVDQRQIDVSG